MLTSGVRGQNGPNIQEQQTRLKQHIGEEKATKLFIQRPPRRQKRRRRQDVAELWRRARKFFCFWRGKKAEKKKYFFFLQRRRRKKKVLDGLQPWKFRRVTRAIRLLPESVSHSVMQSGTELRRLRCLSRWATASSRERSHNVGVTSTGPPMSVVTFNSSLLSWCNPPSATPPHPLRGILWRGS